MAEGLAGVQALFTSALEYHVRVPDQRDAAIEPRDAAYASRGTIIRTPDLAFLGVTRTRGDFAMSPLPDLRGHC